MLDDAQMVAVVAAILMAGGQRDENKAIDDAERLTWKARRKLSTGESLASYSDAAT